MHSSPLNADQIASHLAATDWQVRVAAQAPSSNSMLMGEARLQPEHFARPVLFAVEEQTAGRGRQGRTWLSAPGASLTASFGWTLRLGLGSLSGLSLVCGLAVRAAVQACGAETRLKWPNDVLAMHADGTGGKLAGLLLEAHEIGAASIVVIGIGINITSAAHRQVENLQALQAADLCSAGARLPVDRNRLLADLALALEAHLQRFEAHGFAAFVDDWNAAHAYQDQAVQIIEQQRVIEVGWARGVDAEGQLMLETTTGLRRIRVGDVSLRTVAAGNEKRAALEKSA